MVEPTRSREASHIFGACVRVSIKTLSTGSITPGKEILDFLVGHRFPPISIANDDFLGESSQLPLSGLFHFSKFGHRPPMPVNNNRFTALDGLDELSEPVLCLREADVRSQLLWLFSVRLTWSAQGACCPLCAAAHLELRFLLPRFLRGTFAPAWRASLNPMAMACFRLFTFFLPPDFNWPCLYSCMVFCILLRVVRFDFAPDPEEVRFREDDLLAPLLFLVGTQQRLLLT